MQSCLPVKKKYIFVSCNCHIIWWCLCVCMCVCLCWSFSSASISFMLQSAQVQGKGAGCVQKTVYEGGGEKWQRRCKGVLTPQCGGSKGILLLWCCFFLSPKINTLMSSQETDAFNLNLLVFAVANTWFMILAHCGAGRLTQYTFTPLEQMVISRKFLCT